MAFCAKCGASLGEGATFCGSCGTPVGSAAPGPPPVAPGPPPAASTGMTSNVAGALCYVLGFVTGVVFLVIDPYKNDKFVKFHAFQSIFYSAVAIAFSIIWSVVFAAMFAVSLGAMWSFLTLIWLIVRLALFIGWLFLMYKAYNNERFELPVIGPLAAKQAGY